MEKEEEQLTFEFHCPECEKVWEGYDCNPTREWCSCGSAEVPEALEYEERVGRFPSVPQVLKDLADLQDEADRRVLEALQDETG